MTAANDFDGLCIEFEQLCSGENEPRIEDFLHRVPEGHRSQLLIRLIKLELSNRCGEHATLNEYRERFPEEIAAVEKAWRSWCDQAQPPDQDGDELRPTDIVSSGAENTAEFIGPYKILQPIGKGGMGQVFMAEQHEPVKRRVALKVIKTDTPSKEILGRFEAERQALAMMDHHNIAKVLDAGITEDGRPYFAMELVKGVPITDYCDQNKLTPNERLDLFVQTCRAIQHAHTKGIVHRDIKPSNVLVTLYDGKPVAKVIDFGLAKALQDTTMLTNRTLFTQYGQVVGTLAYMSPEQAEMNSLDVDTRTDVYSLGVILYELLTGSTPLDADRIKSEAFDRILALIREEDPPRPSARLSSSGDAITGISEQRRTEPKRLALILKSDLDWIAVKALEKDRTRRYETAAALADDVQRYLGNEAIEARPPSYGYRLQKTFRKHRTGIVSAGLVVAILAGGLLGFVSIVSSKNARLMRLADELTGSNNELDSANSDLIAANEALQEQKQQLAAARDREATQRQLAEMRLYVADMNRVQVAWDNSNIGLAQGLLTRHRPENAGEADYRGIEWHYWQRECHAYANSFEHQSKYLVSVALSSDGRTLTTVAHSPFRISVWDISTERVTAEYDLSSFNIDPPSLQYRTVLSPDGRTLACHFESETEYELLLLDLNTRKASAVYTVSLEREQRTFPWLEFSQDAATLAHVVIVNDSTPTPEVRLIDVASQKQTARFEGGGIPSLAVSSDGSRVGFSDQRTPSTINVHDVASGDLIRRLDNISAGVLAFSPDSSILAVGGHDGSQSSDVSSAVQLWDVDAGRSRSILAGHTDVVQCLAFSPDGSTLASAGRDRMINLWDVASGQLLATLRGHSDSIDDLAFSSDGSTLVSASRDRTAKLWNVHEVADRQSLAGAGRSVKRMSFSPNGRRLATTGYDKTVRVWEPINRELLLELDGGDKGANDYFWDVSWSPNGALVAAAATREGVVRVWNVNSGNEHLVLPHQSCRAVAFSPDGTIIVSAGFRGMRMWDSATGEMQHEDKTLSAECVAFSPNGATLALGRRSGGHRVITLWALGSKRPAADLEGHEDTIQAIAFSSNGDLLASGSQDSSVRIWNVDSAEEVAKLEGHTSGVYDVAFAADGRTLASVGNDESIILWHVATAGMLASFPCPGSRALDFSPTEQVFAYKKSNDVELWDLRAQPAR